MANLESHTDLETVVVRSTLLKSLTANFSSLPAESVEAAVDAFFNVIERQLVAGGRVEMRGFGVFHTKPRGPYTGRNPLSGEAVPVAAKRAVQFRTSQVLNAKLNQA